MADPSSLLEEVRNSPEGPQIGAFFDFDGTIISGYSATAMLIEKLKRRDMSVEEMFETTNTIAQYSMGQVGFSGLMSTGARFMKGISEESYVRFGEELYQKHISRKIYPEARALVEAHLAKGHTVAIISSATPYQVCPTAQDLGIDHVLCSHYEVRDGEFTGEIIRPLCFGTGKVLAAQQLADEHHIDLDDTFFYSDSEDDMDLLERVGRPRPLNPNQKLTKIAEERSWPVTRFDKLAKPAAIDYVRTAYATGALVTSFLAGLPIWALTGSRREAHNFTLSLFGDLATAIAGVELDVHGEKNLWVSRPAIFIFNHQSKADAMIIAKLIRKDMASIGKEEIKSMPILGKVMEYSGVVFVDRKNSANAISAMAPLIDVIRNEGKSVVIAPEGTRSPTTRLLPFKKGAFHLAMQAGVPIVPIVMHDAIDIAHKGSFVMRPGKVRVDVLPPVDTSDWSTSTIDEHIRDVRAMFLTALGQEAEPDKSGQVVSKRIRAIKSRSPLEQPHKPAARSGSAKGRQASKPAGS